MLKIRILAGVFLIATATAGAQHVCSYANHIGSVYENPLFDKWLSQYDIKFYHFDLEVTNESTFVSGSVTLVAEAVEAMDTLVLQLNDAHTITDVVVDTVNHPLFKHTGRVVYIPVDVNAGELVSVKVVYSGDGGSSGFFAGISRKYESEFDQWVTYTLSEPLNALDWFPVKQVLHDKVDSAWLDFTCDRDLMVGSNGILGEIEEVSAKQHTFRWKTRYPTAYYLFSLAVGDYRDYSFNAPLSAENDSVLVQNFIYNTDTYLERYLDDIRETGNLIELFSGLVIDYPFAEEKYGHTVAPMGGGMEHQTMTTLDNFRFDLVAHELAHQWFGNYVTCGNWQDIWINEGFASYFEYIARENLRTQAAADTWMNNAMNYAKEERDGSVYVPEEDAENVSRVFDYALSYKKGAVLLHMIRHQIDDDEVFFEVLRQYQVRYADSLATAVEFLRTLEEVSGDDYSCFFDQFYYGKGYPEFSILWHRSGDTLHIRSSQQGTSPETPLFNIYFDMEVKYTDGTSEIIRLYQSENEEEFAIHETRQVSDLVFDPGRELLANATVVMDIPEGQNIAVVPNPFINSFQVFFRNFPGNASFELLTLNGQPVMIDMIDSNPYRFNISNLADGPYVIVIESESGRYAEKIVKLGAY